MQTEYSVNNDDEPTLGMVLARTSSRLSDVALVVLAVGGGVGALLAFVLLGRLWIVGLPILSIGAFGAWAIAGRQSVAAGTRALRSVRWVLGVLGVGAIFTFGLALLSLVLGTWIS